MMFGKLKLSVVDHSINKNKNQPNMPKQTTKPNETFLGLLAHGIQKVSQNSLVIFHGVATSEPGYESLPDNSKLSNDVDYETVLSVGEKKPNSDYDPNYEVLVRPVSDSDNLYAKVWEQPQSDDLNDGYSSIKSLKKDLPTTSSNSNHNYASISEANASDAYRITKERHNYSTISESRQEYLDEAQSENKLMSTSGYSTISESKTTPSSDSDTMHTGYDSVDGLRFHNYESLTSESDPNYESVRYTSTDRNPYERLHNDMALSPSDTLYSRLDNSSSKGDDEPSPTSEKSNNDSVEVDDYFQV